MRFLLIVFSIAFLNISFYPVSEHLNLDDAEGLGLHWTAYGNDESTHYDFPLSFEFKNTGSMTIQVLIPAGYSFEPIDSAYQEIILSEDYFLAFKPGQELQLNVKGYCTESSDSGPTSAAFYSRKGMAEKDLADLAKFIGKHDLHGMEAQTAIWAMVEGDSLTHIAGYNEAKRLELVNWMAERTGFPVPPPPAAEDYARNYASTNYTRKVGGSFSFEFPFPTKIRIAMFNRQNVVVRELMEEREMSAGFHEFPFEFDASHFEADIYHFKLIADGEVVVDRTLNMSRSDR